MAESDNLYRNVDDILSVLDQDELSEAGSMFLIVFLNFKSI